MVVVELKILCVQKQYFSHSWPKTLEWRRVVFDTYLFCGLTHQFAEVMKTLYPSKAFALQDNLAFQIVNLIQRVSIPVFSGMNLCHSLNP
jgi:hypothetical protein